MAGSEVAILIMTMSCNEVEHAAWCSISSVYSTVQFEEEALQGQGPYVSNAFYQDGNNSSHIYDQIM